jgi:hypothetical protein
VNLQIILPVTIFVILNYYCNKNGFLKSISTVNDSQIAENSRKLRYWNVCHANWNANGHLRTMNRVFERLGYEYVNAVEGGDWDVVWTFEYPYDVVGRSKLYDPIYRKPLKPHQKINHVPGISVLTNKSFMTTNHRDLNFILPTFNIDSKEDFKEYVTKNPTRKFVEKSYTNRGVKIIDKEKIAFKKPLTMYQAFMENPFLVDGHAFDMGICELINHFYGRNGIFHRY